PRATVTLIDHRGRQSGIVVADGAGAFALAARSAGTYILAATAPGLPPLATHVAYTSVDEQVTVDLRLGADVRENATR
ncbi:carboxypeptidase regulatory-like domain-containing protein, partial [Streptomyces sp. SID10853]|uniref:carboxypeptidase-like regulatory domain-containing protein n=1 Tax=Streptomyces sp. SID10853 TaxID=2706028 RepID=UPI0013C1A480